MTRARALEDDAVDDDRDALVEEREVISHLGCLAQRLGIAPCDVVLVSCGPIGGLSLVRAEGPGVARAQEVEPHVVGRQVIADGQRRLEEQAGTVGFGERLAVELDADLPRAAHDVDAVERVARVAVVALVLLVPGVEAVEVEHHEIGQGIVTGPERIRRATTGKRADSERASVGGVRRKRDARVVHGSVAEHRRAHRRDAGRPLA